MSLPLKEAPLRLKHRLFQSYIEVYEIPFVENSAYQDNRAAQKK